MKKILFYLELLFILIFSVLIVRAWVKGFDFMAWFPTFCFLLLFVYAFYKSQKSKD